MDPQIAFFIAQGISVATGIMAIVMMQLKSMRLILVFQILTNLLASSSYLFLDGKSGMLVSILAVVCSVVMYFYNTKNKKPHLIVAVAFIAVYVASAVYSTVISSDPWELLPAFAATCFALSLIQTKTSYFRIFATLNPIFWLPYDLHTASYIMFIVHFGILLSSVIGMIRIDGLLKNKK
jgi:hypothetical protein